MGDVKSTPLVRSGRNVDSGPITLLTGMGARLRPLPAAKPALPARVAEPAFVARQPTVSAASEPSAGTNVAIDSRKRGVWPIIWAVMVACVLGSGWLGFRNRPPPVVAEHVTPARIQSAELRTPYKELPADPQAALTAGMDRLNAAVAAKPDHSQEEMLTMAARSGRGCTLVFTDHLPSVVFGLEPVRQNSLARTLSDCAEAVSRGR